VSISNWAENAILDAIFNNTALQKNTRYAQLHTGDPGEAGTNNVATETDRVAITGAAAVGGTFTSTNDLEWLSMAGTETISHLSIWDASVAGNCLWTGALTSPQPVNTGNTFTIAAGDLTVSVD
jgi:hypothetical protein